MGIFSTLRRKLQRNAPEPWRLRIVPPIEDEFDLFASFPNDPHPTPDGDDRVGKS